MSRSHTAKRPTRKVNRTLLGTITDRARSTFPNDLIYQEDQREANWQLWLEHWFKTADNVRSELVAEGLAQTVAAVDEIIKEQRKLTCRT